MIEQDFILRLARQIALAIARMAGLRRAGQPAEAARLADEAYGELFGFPPGFLEAASPETLAALVGRERLGALVELVEAEAEALADANDPRAPGRGDLARRLRALT